MNLDPLSFTLSQLSHLVASLSKKNFRDSCQEIAVVSYLPLPLCVSACVRACVCGGEQRDVLLFWLCEDDTFSFGGLR